MIKDSVFRNESTDCMYFKFSYDAEKITGFNSKKLEEKIEIKVLKIGKSRIDNRDMLLFNKKFNEDIIPSEKDMIYLNKRMYKIDESKLIDEDIYQIKISKYESILSI